MSAGPGRSTTCSVACANLPWTGPASRAVSCSIVKDFVLCVSVLLKQVPDGVVNVLAGTVLVELCVLPDLVPDWRHFHA